MAVREISYDGSVYQISYELLNPTSKKSILFLHGWGSNKEIMKNAFSKEFSEYKQLYLDLPGFGNSTVAKIIGTQEYANIVLLLLQSLHVKPENIVGHSFGGKVATLLNPQNLILLSTAGILVPKSLKVKMKIKLFKLFKNLVPKSMYRFFASDDVKGMSQSMYEILKRVVDEDFSKKFETFSGKALIFWGKKDSATPLSSGEKIASLIKNSSFNSYDGDHFFFVYHAKDIAQKIKSGI